MKHLFVSYKLALKLKEKGFNEACLALYSRKGELTSLDAIDYEELRGVINSHTNYNFPCTAPLYQQVVDWLDSKGIHIQITPEFYQDGINWNFQVWEYDSKAYDCVSDRSSMMYGDNHEYPTRIDAINGAIEEALKLI